MATAPLLSRTMHLPAPGRRAPPLARPSKAAHPTGPRVGFEQHCPSSTPPTAPKYTLTSEWCPLPLSRRQVVSSRGGALRPPGATTSHTFEGRQWVPLEEAQRDAEEQFQAGLEAGRREAEAGPEEGAAHSLTLDERTRLVSTVEEVIEAARAEQVRMCLWS